MYSTTTTLTIGDHPRDAGLDLAGTKGVHVCSMYEKQREQFSVVAPYFTSGLRGNEKSLYITDSTPKDDFVEALSKTCDVEKEISSGRLSILTSADTYVKGGRFKVDRMLRAMKDFEKRALADGYSGFRVAGEMTWLNSGKPGVQGLSEYEARLNNLFPKSKASILCLYEEEDLSPLALLDGIHTHPKLWLRGELCDNPYYTPPDVFMAVKRGNVPWDEYERVSRDILRRASVISMHRAESRELLDASRALDLLDSVAFGDMRNQLSIMKFHTELAMDACRDARLLAWLSEIESDCRRIQSTLEAVRDIRTLSIKELEWQNLGSVIRAAEDAFKDRFVRIAPGVDDFEIYADKLLERAVVYILAYLASKRRGSTKVDVDARNVDGAISARFRLGGIGIPEAGKESIFFKGDSTAPNAYGLFAAREILQSTGMTIHEIGQHRKAIEFELVVPNGKHRKGR